MLVVFWNDVSPLPLTCVDICNRCFAVAFFAVGVYFLADPIQTEVGKYWNEMRWYFPEEIQQANFSAAVDMAENFVSENFWIFGLVAIFIFLNLVGVLGARFVPTRLLSIFSRLLRRLSVSCLLDVPFNPKFWWKILSWFVHIPRM
mgnify:CR=1 FL=1